MEELITVKTFTYQYELAVIRGRLESEGIETFVKDELTSQTNPLISNAIGGIKLQVRQQDLQRTLDILKEVGLLDKISEPQISFISKVDILKNKIPILNKIGSVYILLTLIILTVGIAVFGINYLTKPSKYELMTKESWCVDRVVFNQITFQPKTEMTVKVVGPNFCEEGIYFNNKRINLPGFKSDAVYGLWTIHGDTLRIFDCDTFGFVYNGNYYMNFDNGRLVLNSVNTSIVCYKIIFKMPF